MLALVDIQALPAVDTGVSNSPAPIHWSFKPLRQPSVPAKPKQVSKSANPIDLFIAARLREHKLRPSLEADRRTLIRRVYFDLLGLPPTPEDVRAFVADKDSMAYEKRVGKLLASPRYGERWSRHWLDVVRFAESHGFEMNQPRASAWPYRDYVIGAFNEDKPYDRFILEQLAGDALGVDAATGFITGGPWDQVKSPDPVLTANQRADELHDVVSTTGSAFLGLTVGCARPTAPRGRRNLNNGAKDGRKSSASWNNSNRLQKPALATRTPCALRSTPAKTSNASRRLRRRNSASRFQKRRTPSRA